MTTSCYVVQNYATTDLRCDVIEFMTFGHAFLLPWESCQKTVKATHAINISEHPLPRIKLWGWRSSPSSDLFDYTSNVIKDITIHVTYKEFFKVKFRPLSFITSCISPFHFWCDRRNSTSFVRQYEKNKKKISKSKGTIQGYRWLQATTSRNCSRPVMQHKLIYFSFWFPCSHTLSGCPIQALVFVFIYVKKNMLLNLSFLGAVGLSL